MKFLHCIISLVILVQVHFQVQGLYLQEGNKDGPKKIASNKHAPLVFKPWTAALPKLSTLSQAKTPNSVSKSVEKFEEERIARINNIKRNYGSSSSSGSLRRNTEELANSYSKFKLPSIHNPLESKHCTDSVTDSDLNKLDQAEKNVENPVENLMANTQVEEVSTSSLVEVNETDKEVEEKEVQTENQVENQVEEKQLETETQESEGSNQNLEEKASMLLESSETFTQKAEEMKDDLQKISENDMESPVETQLFNEPEDQVDNKEEVEKQEDSNEVQDKSEEEVVADAEESEVEAIAEARTEAVVAAPEIIVLAETEVTAETQNQNRASEINLISEEQLEETSNDSELETQNQVSDSNENSSQVVDEVDEKEPNTLAEENEQNSNAQESGNAVGSEDSLQHDDQEAAPNQNESCKTNAEERKVPNESWVNYAEELKTNQPSLLEETIVIVDTEKVPEESGKETYLQQPSTENEPPVLNENPESSQIEDSLEEDLIDNNLIVPNELNSEEDQTPKLEQEETVNDATVLVGSFDNNNYVEPAQPITHELPQNIQNELMEEALIQETSKINEENTEKPTLNELSQNDEDSKEKRLRFLTSPKKNIFQRFISYFFG